MLLPLHLLFPLFSSVVFVFGMLNAKRAISLGGSPWTSTVLANFWLAAGWGLCGLLTGQLLPSAGWWQAALVALSFVAGQVFTYFAYQHGDVSVATPVFGVKVIIVAVILSGLAGEPISGEPDLPEPRRFPPPGHSAPPTDRQPRHQAEIGEYGTCPDGLPERP